MKRAAWVFGVGLALAIGLGATGARANGRYPASQVILPAPNDPSLLVMRATFGILISHDDGANWDWVCESGVGYQSSEDPPLAVTENDTILAGSFEGLFASTDIGCDWTSNTGGVSDTVIDLAVNPSNPHAAVLVTAHYTGEGDAGGSTFDTRVWTTANDGVAWTQVGAALDPNVLPTTIDVAPSDPNRLYVSGTRVDPTLDAGVADAGVLVIGVMLASSDGGQTWTETTFPLILRVENAPYIAAVDPTDENTVYIRVEGSGGTRLVRTADGAQTFSTMYQAQGDLLGFALSADGSKIYAGGIDDGMLLAPKSTLAFAKQSSVQVQCLAVRGGTLYACSNDLGSGFIAGASTDDGVSFTPLLHLCTVRGPLNCSASSSITTVCDVEWPTQEANLGGACTSAYADAGASADAGPAVDAGPARDAGTSAPPSSSPSKSCSCSSPGAAAASPLVGLGLGALALGLGRRKRRR